MGYWCRTVLECRDHTGSKRPAPTQGHGADVRIEPSGPLAREVQGGGCADSPPLRGAGPGVRNAPEAPSLPHDVLLPPPRPPCGSGCHRARRAGCRELAEHVSAVNKAPGMFRGELGRFRHSALIAASPGRGTRAGWMCLGAARPNCSHLSRSRPPGGERAARKRLRPQSERQSRGIDGSLVRRRPPAVSPRAGRPVDASRPSRVPAAAAGRDAAGPSGRGRAVPRLPGPAPSGSGGALGSASVGSGPGTALGRGGGGAGADGAPTAGKSALAVSHRLLPLSTAHLAPVARPLLVSIFTPFVFFLPTWHLIFLSSSLLCSPPTPRSILYLTPSFFSRTSPLPLHLPLPPSFHLLVVRATTPRGRSLPSHSLSVTPGSLAAGK